MSKYLNESLQEEYRLGQIGITKQGDKMKIIAYNLYSDIWVELLYSPVSYVHTSYGNFLRGSVRNVYRVTSGYHGYFGLGPYSSTTIDKNGKSIETKAYQMWSGIHKRAEDYENRRPAYKDVTVDRCWWDYQKFHEWFDENYYEIKGEVMSLDKDILIPGNKIYGPDKCLIVPLRINDLFTCPHQKDKKGNLPPGISIRENPSSITYRVTLNYFDDNGNKKLLQKVFKTMDEAKKFYREMKICFIEKVALDYKDKLPKHVYDAIIKYRHPDWY